MVNYDCELLLFNRWVNPPPPPSKKKEIIMHKFDISTFRSNGVVAARQKARSGTIQLLTIALSVVLLAACGGGGGGGGNGSPAPGGLPGVTGLQIIPAEGSLRLSWTNPDRDDIRDFNISWVSTTPLASDAELTGDEANKSALAMTGYVLEGLTDGIDYTVSMSVLYAGGGVSKMTADEMRQPGQNTDNDTLPNTLDPDDDDDGVNDFEADGATPLDNCPLIANADQTNTDNANDGGDVCDDDDDNDGVNDFDTDGITQLDACPTGATGWTSNMTTTDNDGDGCRDADEDLDDDNDGVPDAANATTVADNCRLVANPDQNNTDNNVTDGGDACDEDDDNDGLPDVANATTDADNCPLIANADQTNTDNATDGGDACDDDDDNDGFPDLANATTAADNCRLIANADQTNTDKNVSDGGDACDPDDDNDGTNDLADAYPLDACASEDTDNDSAPDNVVADCQTDLTADNCPAGDTDWTSNLSTDNDGDGCRDAGEDLDDNNNRLIEIHTLDDLARLRDDLNGDGIDDGDIDAITAVGDAGCPDSGCAGYELTRSLNFSDAKSYADDSGNSDSMDAWTDRSSGWQPIGSCSDVETCTSYSAVFDGGNYTLADLFINASDDRIGVGLFAAFNGSLQNLHLLNAAVRGSGGSVGSLVGFGDHARYENLSVTAVSVISPEAGSVGGLIGGMDKAELRYAYAAGVNVSGQRGVGGLIGSGGNSDIRYVYVSGGSVTGTAGNSIFIGGLGGSVSDSIRYAYASDVDVFSAGDVLGGLLGYGVDVDIRYAYVSGGNVAGNRQAGGLIGQIEIGDKIGDSSQIHFSYAAGGLVSGSGSHVGGLIGQATNTIVNTSYWDNETTEQPASAKGLGMGFPTAKLKAPENTDFTGIYTLWGNFWCDPNTGEERESATELASPFVRVWDLGTSSQYPALNCMPGGLARQRR